MPWKGVHHGTATPAVLAAEFKRDAIALHKSSGRNELERLHLAASDGQVAQRSELTPGQRSILRALDLPEPPRFFDFTPTVE